MTATVIVLALVFGAIAWYVIRTRQRYTDDYMRRKGHLFELYSLDPKLTGSVFSTEHEARAVCMSRTFTTGAPHWARVDDDGLWHVEPVTSQCE